MGRTTKFAMATLVGEVPVSRGQTQRPPNFCPNFRHGETSKRKMGVFLRGRGTNVPKKNMGPSTCTHMVWETVTRFCTVMKIYWRKTFLQGQSRHLPWPKYFVTRMLIRGKMSVIDRT